MDDNASTPADEAAAARAAGAKARSAKYGALPQQVDPETFVVEIPAIPDDRPEAAPPAPAAAPELIAATEIADARRGTGRLGRRRGGGGRE